MSLAQNTGRIGWDEPPVHTNMWVSVQYVEEEISYLTLVQLMIPFSALKIYKHPCLILWHFHQF